MDNQSNDALEVWEAMIGGSWSLIEWFDTGGRRYILVRPSRPEACNACRLTEREREVASRAALGESNKLIAYRLGMAQNRVSAVLRSALRKLGFRNKAQLVYCVRGLGLPVTTRTPTPDPEVLRKAA